MARAEAGGERSASRPVPRARVALLALCALLLAMDAPPPAETPAAVAAPLPARAEIDAAAVARVVARTNAALSPRELERIGTAVIRYSTKYRLDPELVTAIILVESGGRPGARSPKGALGLMQVMPHVAGPFGIAGNFTTVESNVEAGCLILAHNIRRLGEEDGISAYFWGSEIRGLAYLERVRAARATVRRLLHS